MSKPTKQELIDHVESLVTKVAELIRERDEAMEFVRGVANDINALSTRPKDAIRFSELRLDTRTQT